MISIENDTPAVLDALEDMSSIKSSQPQGIKELRKGTRYKASWRVAAIVEGQDLHEGRTRIFLSMERQSWLGATLTPTSA